MPRGSVDTRSEIRAAAVDLFAERGYESTSLREIAERIGITKAALYYHYASKDALLLDLVDPLFADMTALASSLEEDPRPAREVVERYWDLCHRHRSVLQMVVRSAGVVARAEVAPRMLAWRGRIDAVLTGPAVSERVRAVVALGGLQDAVVVTAEPDLALARGPAVEAALRALGA